MHLNISEITGLQSFHMFVEKQLASQSTSRMSPEEALAAWREEQETLAAIREGLEDVATGRTKSLEDFDRDFRQRHGIEGTE
jgi:hypothetical protein